MLASLLPLHQVFVCKTHVPPKLRRVWNSLQTKLTNERPYLASIDSIKLRLQKLHETDSKTQELKKQGQEGYKGVDMVLHHQGLSFVPKAIRIELISRHYNNPLAGYFDTKKTRELLAQKYYWPTLRHNVEAYVKGCDICLASKTVRHKLYGNLQSLSLSTHW